MLKIIRGQDIALSNADAIVNASNGWGWMGGKRCIEERHKGVAESIQYISGGAVERLSREICKSYIFGLAPGNVFVTDAPHTNANYIIHAVTMRAPGSRAKIKTIKVLIPKIVDICAEMNLKQVAIPLIGTGIGRLPKPEVFEICKTPLYNSPTEFLLFTDFIYNGK